MVTNDISFVVSNNIKLLETKVVSKEPKLRV